MQVIIILQTSPTTLPGLTWVDVEGSVSLDIQANACTKEYEASRTQGIVLDFVFLQGCLGNEKGLPLEVCETLGNKKQNNSRLFHSITQLNQALLQPAGTLLVCCVSGGAALIGMDSFAPPNTVILKTAKNDIFHWK